MKFAICSLSENNILQNQDSSPSFLCSPSLAGSSRARERLWGSLSYGHNHFWESAFITEISPISPAIRHGLLFHLYRAEMGGNGGTGFREQECSHKVLSSSGLRYGPSCHPESEWHPPPPNNCCTRNPGMTCSGGLVKQEVDRSNLGCLIYRHDWYPGNAKISPSSPA